MNITKQVSTALYLSVLATALTGASGYAQTATVSTEGKTVALEKFEVTGSLIKVTELIGPSPVDIVTERMIHSSGVTDTVQLLKKLNPGFQGNGNSSTEVNNGGGGEGNLALRNLTTLILVNGRRMVGSPFSSGTAVDLNTIPLGAIDSIEILKDGASTLYGSDAIGGVVNIKLKKDFNGFEVRARYGATRNRDYTTHGASIIGGVSKPGTSITIGLDTFKNDQLATNQRKVASLDVAGLNALGSGGALPNYYSGSFPGRVGSYMLAGSPLAIGAPGYNASQTSPGIKTDPNAPARTLANLVAAGIYIPTSTTPISVASGGGNTILNTTRYGTASIVPSDRRQMVANIEHEIMGKSLVSFADVLYAQTINKGSVLAPSPLAGLGGNNLIIPANNPYNLFGINLGKGFTGDPGVRTRLEGIGNRYSNNETNTYRAIAGLKGDVNENYSWKVDGTYSKANQTQNVFGGANGSVMNQLLTPLLTNGGYTYDSKGQPLSVATDSLGNIPVFNYFAAGSYPHDSRTLNAFKAVLFKSGATELTQGNVEFTGTPFDLPAGKLGFAVGGEYRKEELVSSVDGLYAQGLALGYNAASVFSGGKRSTKSVFAEVEIPVFGGAFRMPGAYQLNVNVAGRYEKLSSGSGSASKVPRLGFKWLPINQDLAIRGTYAKGFVAPSIFSLFGPAQGNSPTFTVQDGTGTSSGGGTGKSVTGQFGGNVSELSNPLLQPSESVSRTLGVVYSPSQIKGLSLSADYYFIKQNHVGGIDYTALVADLNRNGSASMFAPSFLFADGSKLTSNAANQLTASNIGGIAVQTNPAGEQYTDGLDLGVDYKVPASMMQAYGSLEVGANANVLFNYKFRATPGAGNQQYARQQTSGTYGLGGANGVLPGYKIVYFGVWQFKGFTTTLVANYTPKVTDAGSLFGGQSTTNAQRADGKAYIIPAITTLDLSVGYEFKGRGWSNGIALLAGVNNLTNKTAPYIPDGNEDNTDKRSYDIVGRFYYFEVSKKF
jgi:iron complex outermembrane receptor protein